MSGNRRTDHRHWSRTHQRTWNWHRSGRIYHGKSNRTCRGKTRQTFPLRNLPHGTLLNSYLCSWLHLTYERQNRSIFPQTLDVHYPHFATVLSCSLPAPIEAGRLPLAQNSAKIGRSLNRLLRKDAPILPFTL